VEFRLSDICCFKDTTLLPLQFEINQFLRIIIVKLFYYFILLKVIFGRFGKKRLLHVAAYRQLTGLSSQTANGRLMTAII